jgi:hypothetical protein
MTTANQANLREKSYLNGRQHVGTSLGALNASKIQKKGHTRTGERYAEYNRGMGVHDEAVRRIE